MACSKCGALLFDPKASTVHMRVDPTLMEMRRRRVKPTGSLSQGRVISLQIRGVTERLAFEEGTEIVLGRIDLANPDMSRFDLTRFGGHERGVSREHALLRYTNEDFTVTDLKSANGTSVNGQRLRPNEQRVLKDGDELMLGSLVVRIKIEPPHEPKESSGATTQPKKSNLT